MEHDRNGDEEAVPIVVAVSPREVRRAPGHLGTSACIGDGAPLDCATRRLRPTRGTTPLVRTRLTAERVPTGELRVRTDCRARANILARDSTPRRNYDPVAGDHAEDIRDDGTSASTRSTEAARPDSRHDDGAYAMAPVTTLHGLGRDGGGHWTLYPSVASTARNGDPTRTFDPHGHYQRLRCGPRPRPGVNTVSRLCVGAGHGWPVPGRGPGRCCRPPGPGQPRTW